MVLSAQDLVLAEYCTGLWCTQRDQPSCVGSNRHTQARRRLCSPRLSSAFFLENDQKRENKQCKEQCSPCWFCCSLSSVRTFFPLCLCPRRFPYSRSLRSLDFLNLLTPWLRWFFQWARPLSLWVNESGQRPWISIIWMLGSTAANWILLPLSLFSLWGKRDMELDKSRKFDGVEILFFLFFQKLKFWSASRTMVYSVKGNAPVVQGITHRRFQMWGNRRDLRRVWGNL